jgi:hypothetical protein
MPLPATWLALPHVGPAGDQGPDPAARTDPQVHRLLRRGQPQYRTARAHDVQGLQRRDLPALSQAAAAPSNAPPPHDSRARQRSLPSRRDPQAIPAPAGAVSATALSTTLQPAARLDRACLEAYSAPGDSQQILRHTRRSAPGRQHLLRSVVSTACSIATPMLHYLRRCVYLGTLIPLIEYISTHNSAQACPRDISRCTFGKQFMANKRATNLRRTCTNLVQLCVSPEASSWKIVYIAIAT